jgi:hypothetical protein
VGSIHWLLWCPGQVLDQLKVDVAKRQMQRSRPGNTPWRQLSK